MNLKTTLCVLLVIFIWASNFVAIKLGVQEIDPLVLLSMRFFTAGLLFLPFSKWPGWRVAIMMMVVGTLMGPLHQGFLYVGMTEVPASLMSILLQSNIIMVTLIGWFFLKESVGWRTWAGIFVGMLGVVVLLGLPEENVSAMGYALALISAFFLAFNYIGIKKLGAVHPATYITYMSLPVAPFIMISSYFIEGTDWINQASQINWTIVIIVVLYQAILLSLSHMLWQRLMSRMPVSQLVPWTLLIPVIAVVISILFLDETLTWVMFIGGVLTISGVAIVTFRRIRKKQI